MGKGDVIDIKNYGRWKHCKGGCVKDVEIVVANIDRELLSLRSRATWRDTCEHKKECLEEIFLYFVKHIKKYV